MSGGHKIVKCSCGAVIAQCRCMELNKAVVVIANGCEACKKKIPILDITGK
jgi:hypothetical protein